MRNRALPAAAIVAALMIAACGKPGADGLRDSFAQQVASNRFIRDYQRNGDDLTFSGPGAEGGTAKWRVHIDSAVVEPNDDAATRAAQPYKGVVKSSWYSDDQLVRPSGRDSNLPIELLSNGVSQDCWAFWDEAAKKWSW
jgi:hypothetical protein